MRTPRPRTSRPRFPSSEADRLDAYADDARRALVDPLVAVARISRMAPLPEAVFIDPLTRERITYATVECDTLGSALVGVDEHHAWVGACRALLVIDGDTRYFEVWGYLGAEAWCGRLAASSEDAVERYVERLGVVDYDIEALSLEELEAA